MSDADDPRPGSRDRILIAAATMLSEDPATRLSVRAVAARAGVSTGSLRHHFPTQRALQDAVLAGVFDMIAPADPIGDTTLPARERLIRCLRHLLAAGGTGEQARESWRHAFETFIVPEPTAQVRQTYVAQEREAQRRVEHWLSVLADEGELPVGEIARRATFLLTVLSGLALERAMPGETSTLVAENATLALAVDTVLGPRASAPEPSPSDERSPTEGHGVASPAAHE